MLEEIEQHYELFECDKGENLMLGERKSQYRLILGDISKIHR